MGQQNAALIIELKGRRDALVGLVEILARTIDALEITDGENEQRERNNKPDGIIVFSQAQAAAKFQVDEDTFARLRVAYNFPHFKLGHQYRFRLDQMVEITEIMGRRDSEKATRRLRKVS